MHHGPSISLEVVKAGTSPIFLLGKQTHTNDEGRKGRTEYWPPMSPKFLIPGHVHSAKQPWANAYPLGKWSSTTLSLQATGSPGIRRQCVLPLTWTVQLKKGSGKGRPYCFTEGKDTNGRAPSPDSLLSGWGRGREGAGKCGLGKGQFPIRYWHFIVVVAVAVVMEISEPPSPLTELEWTLWD